MAESVLLPAGVCSNFEPQRWRRKKCKTCFHDIFRHGDRNVTSLARAESSHMQNRVSPENGVFIPGNQAEHFDDKRGTIGNDVNFDMSGTATVTANLVDDEVELIFRPQDEGTMDDYDGEIEVESKGNQTEVDQKQRSESFDIEEKSRKESNQHLTRLPTIDRSSNSSLNSCDLILDEGSNEYPSYGGSRETLDSFSFNSGDLVEDTTLVRERDTRIIFLEQEIEKLTDSYRASVAGKDRHIQSLECEIQNLKLEIANFTARENVSVLRSRLELESKSLKIHDLECELRHLNDTIEKMTVNKHFEESDQYNLQRELTRSKNKITTLEEEKKTLEERLILAEDLQNNDRELLEVLRHQLTALEKDLSFCQERTKGLEERNKVLEKCEHDLIEEKSKYAKLLRQYDALANKLHQRDKQINDLEDDVVRLQQLNMDYRKEINRDLEVIEKLEATLLLRQKEVDECSREVMVLASEKKKLYEQQSADIANQGTCAPCIAQVKEMESKLSESDQQIHDLQQENDQLIREIGDLLENLSNVNSELEEAKEQVHKAEKELESFRRTRRDNERKIHSLQKKLNRVDREKKKFLQEKIQSEKNIAVLQAELDKASGQCDEGDKSKKMLLLKLQSTEAKLAMLEGNKIYTETKLNSYRAKIKEQASLIEKFGIPSDSDTEQEVRDLKEPNLVLQNRMEMTQLISQENDKIISELRNQNKDFSVSLVAMQREIKALKSELSRAQALKDKLDYHLKRCAGIMLHVQEQLGKTVEYLNEPEGQCIENIKFVSASIHELSRSLILQLSQVKMFATNAYNSCSHKELENDLCTAEGSYMHFTHDGSDNFVVRKAVIAPESQTVSSYPGSLRDQLNDLKDHIQNVENITSLSSLFQDKMSLQCQTGCLSSKSITDGMTQAEINIRHERPDVSKEFKVLKKWKHWKLRSVSAPELRRVRFQGVAVGGTNELHEERKSVGLLADIDNGDEALKDKIAANSLPVHKKKLDSTDNADQQEVKSQPIGKFIVQAKGRNVHLQGDQHGSVVIKIGQME